MKKLSSLSSIAYLLALVVIFTGCQKNDVFNSGATLMAEKGSKGKFNVVRDPNLKFLGHRGAGSNNYNDVNMENSIPSIKQALAVMDGVEVDVQMSLDGTLWLFHDSDVNYTLCTPGAPRSIITMHDDEIAKLKLCSRTKNGRVYKYSELINLFNSPEYPKGFYISMDIKTEHPAATLKAVGGEEVYLRKFAQQLAKELSVLTHSASLIMMEQDHPAFISELKKYNVGKLVKYYMDGYRSFDIMVADALKLGYDGVSVIFTDKAVSAKKIAAAQAKGLKIQLWTPYYDSEVYKCYNMHPDFIQTDQTYVQKDLGL